MIRLRPNVYRVKLVGLALVSSRSRRAMCAGACLSLPGDPRIRTSREWRAPMINALANSLAPMTFWAAFLTFGMIVSLAG